MWNNWSCWDPAIRMFPADKADYSIQESDITLDSFEGEVFQCAGRFIEVVFVLKNLGRVDFDSVEFKISQTSGRYPGQLSHRTFAPIFRKDTIVLLCRIQEFRLLGKIFSP